MLNECDPRQLCHSPDGLQSTLKSGLCSQVATACRRRRQLRSEVAHEKKFSFFRGAFSDEERRRDISEREVRVDFISFGWKVA